MIKILQKMNGCLDFSKNELDRNNIADLGEDNIIY